MFINLKNIFYYIFDIIFFILAFFVKIFSIDSYKNTYKDKNKKETIIICNGPSLSEDIDWIVKRHKDLDISAVHFFANTDYFFKVKPRYFFLADPIFWRKDIEQNFKENNSKMFKNFEKVNWHMNIICRPKGYKVIKNKIKNKFIKVEKIRHWSIDFKSKFISVLSLRMNLITPLFSTVAVMALWHAISRGRKKIYLYGADFTHFREYSVDQNTNKMINNSFSHFYKNSKAENNANLKNSDKIVLFNTILYKCWSSFEQMYLISRLAKIRGIDIFNCSKNSYLDCFNRRNLKDVK